MADIASTIWQTAASRLGSYIHGRLASQPSGTFGADDKTVSTGATKQPASTCLCCITHVSSRHTSGECYLSACPHSTTDEPSLHCAIATATASSCSSKMLYKISDLSITTAARSATTYHDSTAAAAVTHTIANRYSRSTTTVAATSCFESTSITTRSIIANIAIAWPIATVAAAIIPPPVVEIDSGRRS